MVKENSIYTHYKGDDYEILFVVKDSTNERDGTEMVVYRSITKGIVHCRDLAEFIAEVEWPDGVMRSRFIEKESL